MITKPSRRDIAAIILVGAALHAVVYSLDATLAMVFADREVAPRVTSALVGYSSRIMATFILGLVLCPVWNLVFVRVFPVPRLGYWHAFVIAMMGGLIWDGLPYREPLLF